MSSNAAAAIIAERAARYDSPWRRLPWTGPLALLAWALAIWGMSLVMTRAPAMPEQRMLAIDARIIELPKPPAQPPAVVRPESPPTPSAVPRPRQRVTQRSPAKSANNQTAEPTAASESTQPTAETATGSPQADADATQATQTTQNATPGSSSGKSATGGKPRFANHPGAGIRAGAVGVVPPPQDLTVANEEQVFNDGLGGGWSPGGWAQDSNAEYCVNDPANPGPCPGQVFTFPGRPWCYDSNPIYSWDIGTCKDQFDRATAAFKRQDYETAFAGFLKLAEKDYVPAQSNMCTIYAEGTGTPKDAQQAVHWCRKAAAAGDSKATYNLALMYSDGIGVPKDDKEAAHWYRKAAFYGYANAQYNLAVMYTHGIGVPQDDKKAAYWYRRAAYRGNVQAQYNLGVMYSEGAGVPQDDKQAVYWYCKGTVRGEEKAQASLAKMYSTDGTSAEKDELIYFCWLFSADKRNNFTAYADRHLYDRKLSPEQRERAIASAAVWKRK